MSEYNLKSIRKDFKEKGIFYTQPELAKYLKSFLPDDVSEIYDPTCGNGGLLSVFADDAQKYGQDVNADQVREAEKRLKNFHGATGDTLKEPAFWGKKFKYIIANPPFSLKWEQKTDERFEQLPCLPPKSKADYAFLAHILYYLSEDGTAVVLNFPGILYRGNAEGKIRRRMIEQNYIDTVVAVDNGHFVDTNIATAVLILKKNRTTTDIKFIHNEKEKIVPLSEIAANDYGLSVSHYIDETQPKEEIDIDALNHEIREINVRELELKIEIDRIIAEIEGELNEEPPLIRDMKEFAKRYETHK